MSDFTEVGFDELREYGYITDRVSINPKAKTIRPAFDLKNCMGVGYPKGTRMIFINENGYEHERQRALEALDGKILTVVECHISDWSSDYVFEEVAGEWNTVMFKEYKHG